MTFAVLLRPVGGLLRGLRAGPDGLVTRHPAVAAAPDTLKLRSPAFADGGAIPAKFCGAHVDLSPPLTWSGVPARTQSLALLMEDADIPWRRPLLHLLSFGIAPHVQGLPEGAFSRRPPADAPALVLGYNGLGRRCYLAPAALPGHGPHRY